DMMLTGAEAITPQGSAICKIGTYLAALAAREAGVPYFILADTLKFIPPFIAGFLSLSNRVVLPNFSNNREAEGFELINHLFDETPAKLITGVVTELGIISPLACGAVNHRELISDRLIRILSSAGIITELQPYKEDYEAGGRNPT
ncbi:MAG: hypothetical protein IMZ53_10605, partial [Thermoplasmata archaeon]|nr:hypothetical protein [Thermoplasmata archaeon]